MNSQNGSLLSLKLGTGRTITAPCMYHLVERYGSFGPPPKNECTQHTDTCSSKRSHMQMFIRRKRWNETRINMEPTYLAFITSKLLRHRSVGSRDAFVRGMSDSEGMAGPSALPPLLYGENQGRLWVLPVLPDTEKWSGISMSCFPWTTARDGSLRGGYKIKWKKKLWFQKNSVTHIHIHLGCLTDWLAISGPSSSSISYLCMWLDVTYWPKMLNLWWYDKPGEIKSQEVKHIFFNF